MKKDKKHIPSGFNTPPDYFDTFEEKLLHHLEQENSVNPLPERIESGFTLPPAYLDRIEDQIFEQLPTETPKEKTTIIPLYTPKKIQLIASLAAMIAIIITIYIVQKPTPEPLLVTATDVHTYINDGYIELTDTEIATLFDEDATFTSLATDIPAQESLIDYLSDTDIDTLYPE